MHYKLVKAVILNALALTLQVLGEEKAKSALMRATCITLEMFWRMYIPFQKLRVCRFPKNTITVTES